MTARDRLRQLASALPSDDSAVTFTRAGLVALLDEDDDGDATATSVRDLTVEEVAEEMHKAPSTVRGWLISGALRGYKFSNREWRVTRSALRDYIARQAATSDLLRETTEGDITAWRRVRGSRHNGRHG